MRGRRRLKRSGPAISAALRTSASSLSARNCGRPAFSSSEQATRAACLSNSGRGRSDRTGGQGPHPPPVWLGRAGEGPEGGGPGGGAGGGGGGGRTGRVGRKAGEAGARPPQPLRRQPFRARRVGDAVHDPPVDRAHAG